MSNNKNLKKLILIGQISLLAVLSGCQAIDNKQPVAEIANIQEVTADYDCQDNAIVIDIDKQNMTIQFKTMAINKYYTLNYDGASLWFDKNNQALSLDQIKEGDIVSVLFRKFDKRLYSMNLADDTFVKSNVSEFEIYGNSTKMKIAGEEYSLSSNISVITSSGLGELMDISNVDVLCVQGYDHTINSIRVERGHGYIKLLNDTYFIGGWIDVGEKVISKIEEDMILPVPAGTFQVSVSNEGCSGYEDITILEGQEYQLDVSKWQGQVKTGKLIFTITPVEAKVYIDGDQVNVSEPVELDYGLHQMIIVADGYKTISKYVKVGSASASLNIRMEESDDESASSNDAKEEETQVISPSENAASASDNQPVIAPSPNVQKPESSSENAASESTSVNKAEENKNSNESTSQQLPEVKEENVDSDIITNGARVYIDGPENVEVYVDGKYIGLSPVNFAKTKGQIVVTLRKTGYQTRSYTLDLDGDNEDVNYSFSELLSISE